MPPGTLVNIPEISFFEARDNWQCFTSEMSHFIEICVFLSG